VTARQRRPAPVAAGGRADENIPGGNGGKNTTPSAPVNLHRSIEALEDDLAARDERVRELEQKLEEAESYIAVCERRADAADDKLREHEEAVELVGEYFAAACSHLSLGYYPVAARLAFEDVAERLQIPKPWVEPW
jgi:hypothetical protein